MLKYITPPPTHTHRKHPPPPRGQLQPNRVCKPRWVTGYTARPRAKFLTLLQSNFTASMGYFPLYSFLNFPVLQSLFGLVSILHFDGILFYILQVHPFSSFTARTLVIFHSTFSKNASLRLYVLHINPPQ